MPASSACSSRAASTWAMAWLTSVGDQLAYLRGGERPRQLFAGGSVVQHRDLVAVAVEQFQVGFDVDLLVDAAEAAFGEQGFGLVAQAAIRARVELDFHAVI